MGSSKCMRECHVSESESVVCDPWSNGISGRLSLAISGDAGSNSLIPLIDRPVPFLRLLVCLFGPVEDDVGVKAWKPSDCRRANISRAMSAVSLTSGARVPSVFKLERTAGRFSAPRRARPARRPTVSPLRSFSSSVSRAARSSS